MSGLAVELVKEKTHIMFVTLGTSKLQGRLIS